MKRKVTKDRKPAKKAAPKIKHPQPAPPSPPVAKADAGLCADLPACTRPGCGASACEHAPEHPHALSGTNCEGYNYPTNWYCQSCGAPSTEHDEAEPYPGPNCAAFEHVAGQTTPSFLGGGGRFGGGGATGSW